jgi:formate hydrogenlyase subunit 3/multisubunit Na+/H+ antiporter MnhD subunit
MHLLLNHAPVIGIFVILFVFAAALARKNDAIAKLGLVMLVGVAVVTVAVFFTGEPAEEAVENLAGVSETLIHSHEEAAEAAFIATGIAGAAALLLLFAYRRRQLSRWALGASFALTLVVSGLMAWTANLGGQIRHSEIRPGAASIVEADADASDAGAR